MAEQQRSDRRNSNSQLLQELDALSQNLYQSHTARRTASFVLPRSANAAPSAALSTVTDAPPPASAHPRPRSRRLSMSPFRSRPKSLHLDDDDDNNTTTTAIPAKNQPLAPLAGGSGGEKKGIWSWKPMRALSHIGMQRLGCLFSVEVVAVQGLPPSMNGLRLSVAVRKKETKDGAVQTMPARVLQGAADLEETLFVRCHVYCSGKPPKFEPRPFLVYALAIDAPELDFGRSTVDLSLLVQESMERNLEGTRIRQWDVAFPLMGKAKGGELVVKLGFQIMEDGGVGIYNQAAEGTKGSRSKGPAHPSSPVARGQSKSSFSVSSPRITRAQPPPVTPSSNSAMDLKGIDEFNLDGPAPPPPPPPRPSSSSSSIQKVEPESKTDELDLPEFDVIDRGVEIQEKDKEDKKEAAESEEAADEASVASEVVKEVVHDSAAHQVRMTELDEIANQIKALESMVIGDENEKDPSKTEQEDSNQQLDAEEETVTKEFLQMLELEDELSFDMPQLASETNLGAEEGADGETKSFLSDLGKGLGPVVQTRDGGYLASMNPLDSQVARKDTPKLAMQLSKPVILRDQKLTSGIEVFQKLAAVGMEELSSKLASLTSMDELMGKTAEQIAFEGMASVIISRRAKEGASSSAARSVAVLKTMAAAMNDGRKERIATGIWNVKEEPAAVEEILPFVLQKIEVMAVEALKIQGEVAEEEAPFDVSLAVGKDQGILDYVALPEEWEKCCEGANEVTMLVLVQLRDPLRRYEAVGAPVIAVVQAARAGEGRFKVTSLHAGGMRIRSGGGTKSNWDGEKQRLTAMQWLVAYGLAKAGKKKKDKNPKEKGSRDMVWSLSSRIMADMWLKPIRNPDVKFLQKS